MKLGKKLNRRLMLTAAAVLAAVCIVCDSKFNLQVSRYELVSGRLPPEFSGFRIVQLSDLHGASFGGGNRRLIRAVQAQQPDMIALTGDFAGSFEELEAVRELAEGIASIAPTYYVRGNHEWAGGCAEDICALMDSCGVICLSNSFVALERQDAQIVIAGVEDPNGRADMIQPQAFIRSLRENYPEQFTILLGHRNYWVQKYPFLPVQLILSGHAHGGIVRLPFVGGVFSTERAIGAEYEDGLYYSGDYCMCVSRGLGGSQSVPRIFNRPEIVVLELTAAEKSL